MEKRQAKQKQYHDRSKRNVMLGLGQEVLVRVFRRGLKRWERGHIAKILGSRVLLVELGDGTVVKRHLDQVQHFASGDGGVGKARSEAQDTLSLVSDADCSEPDLSEIQDIPSTDSPMLEEDMPIEAASTTLENEAPYQVATDDSTETSTSALEGETVCRYPSRNHRPPERPFLVTH